MGTTYASWYPTVPTPPLMHVATQTLTAFEEAVYRQGSGHASRTKERDELEEYLKEERVGLEVDPLVYWKASEI